MDRWVDGQMDGWDGWGWALAWHLPRSRLSIREDGAVPSVEGLVEQIGTQILVHCELIRVVVVRKVKIESPWWHILFWPLKRTDTVLLDDHDLALILCFLASIERTAAHGHHHGAWGVGAHGRQGRAAGAYFLVGLAVEFV